MSDGVADGEASERPRVWSEGELVSACCAAVLLASMVAVDWYGVVGLPRGAQRSGVDSAVSGWHELSGLRWAILITVIVALGAVVLHATQRSHGTKTSTGLIVWVLGTVTAALLANRVLLALPAPSTVVDVKLGGFVGLLAAIGIALGGHQTLREERESSAISRREPLGSRSGS